MTDINQVLELQNEISALSNTIWFLFYAFCLIAFPFELVVARMRKKIKCHNVEDQKARRK